MLVYSLWQIDFITALGTVTLLSYGDDITEELAPAVTGKSTTYAPIGAGWGEADAEDGTLAQLDWTVIRTHASHAELRSFCMRHAATLPLRSTGTLRMSIKDGEVWDIEDAVISSGKPLPYVSGRLTSVTSYSAVGGRMMPVGEVAPYPGIPWEYLNQDWENLTDDWENY